MGPALNIFCCQGMLISFLLSYILKIKVKTPDCIEFISHVRFVDLDTKTFDHFPLRWGQLVKKTMEYKFI